MHISFLHILLSFQEAREYPSFAVLIVRCSSLIAKKILSSPVVAMQKSKSSSDFTKIILERTHWRMTAEALVHDEAFVHLSDYVMSLPRHKYQYSSECPEDVREWCQKGWSLVNVFIATGLKLDPGNRILFFTLQILIRCFKKNNSLGTKLHRIQAWVTTTTLRSLSRRHSSLSHDCAMVIESMIDQKYSNAGDIIEAVGGVCHPTRWEASELRKYLAENGKFGLAGDEVAKRLLYGLTKLVQLVSDVWYSRRWQDVDFLTFIWQEEATAGVAIQSDPFGVGCSVEGSGPDEPACSSKISDDHGKKRPNEEQEDASSDVWI